MKMIHTCIDFEPSDKYMWDIKQKAHKPAVVERNGFYLNSVPLAIRIAHSYQIGIVVLSQGYTLAVKKPCVIGLVYAREMAYPYGLSVAQFVVLIH